MLDNIYLDAYGSKTPLNQLGNISVQDASTITIQIWDTSLIKVIENAIKKISEIINSCYDKGVSEILIITGKGIHSKSSTNVYISDEFSKLRNTIPEFIKNNSDLNSKINEIEQADQGSGGSGALLIKLKKIIR